MYTAMRGKSLLLASCGHAGLATQQEPSTVPGLGSLSQVCTSAGKGLSATTGEASQAFGPALLGFSS